MNKNIIRIMTAALVFVFFLSSCSGQNTTPSETGKDVMAGVERRSELRNAESLSTDDINETSVPVEPVSHVNLSFIAVGDNLIHPNIYTDAALRASGGREFDFRPMYEYVAPYIRNADIAFINQETVMAGAEFGYSGYPCFNCPRQLGEDMVEIGFDVINIANNHELDMGENGYRNTLDFWHTQPVTLLGGHYDENDYSTIRVTEYDDFKIAWLSYTYGTNGIELPWGSEMVVPYIDEERILSDIARAETLGDITIVSIHWGIEYMLEPTYDQTSLAKKMADAGAEIILGHHSHCLEPIEWIDTERGKTLCIYSLGNFACGQAQTMTLVGGMFTFTITDENGKIEVINPVLHPTICYYDWNWHNTRIYPLDQYTDDIAVTHGLGNLAINGALLSPAVARDLVKSVIAPEFLPDYLK